jgi:hypothetical protein
METPLHETEIYFIRNSIEKMSIYNQLGVLRILKKNNLDNNLNENQYGIHVNLSGLSTAVLNELLLYINYIHTQEKNLQIDEQQKETIKNTFFSKI